MRPRSLCPVTLVVLILVSPLSRAQGSPPEGKKELTLEMAISRPFAFFARGPAGLAWHPDGKRVVWVKEGALVASPPSGGNLETLVTEKSLKAAISAAGFKIPAAVALRASTWNEDGRSLRLFFQGALYRIQISPLQVNRLMVIPKDSEAQSFSPGDQNVAYVKAHNISVVKADGDTYAATKDGHDDVTYGVAASRSEFGIHDGLWWSPSARRLAFFREDLAPIARYPYSDFDSVPAKIVHGRYPMAGQAGSKVKIGIYDTRNDSVVYLKTDPAKDEYLTNATWNPDGTRLFIAHVNRAQDSMDLVEYDAKTGGRVALHFTENDAEWIEPESGPIFLEDGSGSYLWFSYKSGHRHLHLHAADGKPVRQITAGKFDVSEFKGWGAEGHGFFFVTTGPDPRQKHLYYAGLSGVQRAVTSGRGQHTTQLSPTRKQIIDSHSNLELPLAVDILDSSGRRLLRLHEAKNPLAEYRMGRQEFFTLKSKDGSTLYGYALLPPNMDPAQKYPVIQYVYGGPHAQLVTDQWLGGRSRWMCWQQYMASQGYVVVTLDNHGTPHRGIEFQQAIFRKMGTLEIEEQSQALDFVIKKGWGDPARVGVTGWSYGGFMTLSLMTRKGDRYSAGVAGAPVTDWSYYETGYGERYMDTPAENPEGYKTSDPANHVKGIKGRLLVVQGTSDATVMWQNTIHFLNRCIQEGVAVDYMVYPGQKHGLVGKHYAHFLRKMTRYFRDHLRKKHAPRKNSTGG